MSDSARQAGRLRRAARAVVSARVRALLSVGVLCGLLSVSARAQWTDGATAVATFSTGSIDLRLGSPPVDDLPAGSWTLALGDMVPGSQVAASVEVRNVGTVPLDYSMSATTTGALATGLRLSVSAGACPGGTALVTGVALTGASFGGRPLTASGGATPAETLCFTVTLAGDAPSSLQGTVATATFTFTAVSS